MQTQADDECWMMKAIDLAGRGEGSTRPNPPVGAILVSHGVKAGQGYHKKAGGDHAEILAIKQAGQKAGNATLYVTLEPCSTQGRTPACTDAIIRAGITRVVISAIDPNRKHNGKGIKLLRTAGIIVDQGVCRSAGMALIEPFAKWVNTQIPFLTVKAGMTIDGKIADAMGSSRWITSWTSRKMVHDLRRRVDAIIIGTNTAIRDDPSLLSSASRKSNLYRVILDSNGKLPLNARVLNDDYTENTIIATTRLCPQAKIDLITKKGANVWILPQSGAGINLKKLIAKLGEKGCLHVLCEGGGELIYELANADLVDQYLFFVAPKILGGRNSVPVIGGKGRDLASALDLKFVDCRMIHEDILVKAVPSHKTKMK